jgi:predicted PurR-regulated permease PerM
MHAMSDSSSVSPRERRREWRLAGIVFFSLITLVVLWTAFRIIQPFLSAILIAAILATLTYPSYRRLRARAGGRSGLAAIVMLVGITLIIILPTFILVLMLVQQANGLIQHLQSGEAQAILAKLDPSQHLEWFRRHIPGFDPASFSPQRLILPVVRGLPGWVAHNGGAVVGGLAGLLIGFGLVLLAMYFFYTEGEAIVAEIGLLSPLPERYDREFATQFKSVIDATFRGHVLTSLAQGVATTIGMVIAQVPAALFWGAVSTVMSLIPMIGSAAVWIPAAIYLYASAAMGKEPYWHAIFLTIWGAVVVSLIDNVVRTWAMKGKSELPAVPLLVSVIGGMEAFGVIGLVIGPLVFSLLMSIVDIYKRSFGVPHRRVDDAAR